MNRMVPLLGRDITERVFLDRFIELCKNETFCVRKICALNIGNFCVVSGKSTFDTVLVRKRAPFVLFLLRFFLSPLQLPCYIKLCNDENWGVRKACVEVTMSVSYVCSSEQRQTILAPVFVRLLDDSSRWVQTSAFQVLGPFISTFADPNISNLNYNCVDSLDVANEPEK